MLCLRLIHFRKASLIIYDPRSKFPKALTHAGHGSSRAC